MWLSEKYELLRMFVIHEGYFRPQNFLSALVLKYWGPSDCKWNNITGGDCNVTKWGKHNKSELF